MNSKGITLIALVITIIILLILAGISIETLTGSGLFENTRLAEEKTKNAQELENTILKDYENKIGEYVGGTRESKVKIKNLLDNKEIFPLTTGSYKTIGSTIKLNDSIKNYDELRFTTSLKNSNWSDYSAKTNYCFMVEDIEFNNSEVENFKSDIRLEKSLINSANSTETCLVLLWFKDSSNMYISLSGTTNSGYTNMKLEAIYGIKY